MKIETNDWMTVREAADAVGVTTQSVRERVQDEKLTGARFFGVDVVRKDEIPAWRLQRGARAMARAE